MQENISAATASCPEAHCWGLGRSPRPLACIGIGWLPLLKNLTPIFGLAVGHEAESKQVFEISGFGPLCLDTERQFVCYDSNPEALTTEAVS